MNIADELRIYLSLAGVLLFAAVYWFTKRQRRASRSAKYSKRIEKVAPPRSAKVNDANSQVTTTITMRVKAVNGKQFSGARILRVAKGVGFKTSGASRGVFTFVVNDRRKDKVMFLVASMFEPGEFEWERMDEFYTRGLILIAPSCRESEVDEIRKRLSACAAEMATKMGGVVLDEEGKAFPVHK